MQAKEGATEVLVVVRHVTQEEKQERETTGWSDRNCKCVGRPKGESKNRRGEEGRQKTH